MKERTKQEIINSLGVFGDALDLTEEQVEIIKDEVLKSNIANKEEVMYNLENNLVGVEDVLKML